MLDDDSLPNMRNSTFALWVAMCSVSAPAASWEDALRGKEPAAQQRIRLLCSEQAGQSVYGTIDGASSVALIINAGSMAGAAFSSESSGVSYTHLPSMYLRMGLREVEFDARLGSGSNPENQPVAVFDTRSRTTRFTASYQAEVEIVYSDAASPEDKTMGIYGRKIQVRVAATKQTLGERTEFFWFHGTDPRERVRMKDALCPGFAFARQMLPTHFIGEVVNPRSYPCMANFVRDATTAKEMSSREYSAARGVQERISAWSKASLARETALLDTLNLCEANYFAGPALSRSSISWRTAPPK